MTPPLFVVERERLLAGRHVVLDGPEGRHAARVRRLRVGERVDLTDGSGTLAECLVGSSSGDTVGLEVLGLREDPEPRVRLVVVQALPKGDRGELAVAAMTEVGVDEIVPWTASRCVTQWRGDRGRKALERWRSTAREAAKQSHRVWFPRISEPASTPAVAAKLGAATLGVVLHEQADAPVTGLDVPARGMVVMVVGPEGGLTADETGAFAAAGAGTYRLGPTVLRTSTAGVAAAAVLLARSGRWG